MIFDLDGTLVQTERLKALSYARAAIELRPDLTEAQVVEAFRDFVGLPRQEVAVGLMERFDLIAAADTFKERHHVGTAWQAFVQLRLTIYERMLNTDGLLLAHRWPYNLALLEHARSACDHVGLATMSHCREVNHVLTVLGLTEAFDFVASRDDVNLGKPDPEIYALVARELRTIPTECLVIEDSVAGVRAALAAGMHCIAVGTPFTKDALHQSGVLDSRWIVDNPADILAVVDRKMIAIKGAVQ